MRRLVPAMIIAAALSGGLPAEIIDRVAVSLGKQAVTESALVEHLRIAAFLDNSPLVLSGTAKRRAAERMIEQALIRKEMDISRYPLPPESEASPLLDRIRKERFGGDESAFRQALAQYGISESSLRRHLLLQLAVLRFIEIRFRPSVSVADGEIAIYYRDHFLPEWEKTNANGRPPELDEVRDTIDAVLIQIRVDQALDRWLREARQQTRVEFFEEAFQ